MASEASLILNLVVREAGSSAAAIGGISNRMIGLAAGAAGVTAAIASSVTKAADFDLTIRQVGAAANIAGAELKSMSDLALKMGADTSFSASQAATAMLELAKGGLTAADIKAGALKGTLTLAAAGGIELADAATVMSNTMNGFGLAATDAGAIAAAFAGGANASSASVESLTQALMQVGPGARIAGLTLQDTVGVLAAFDQNMLKGSDAGTSLKTMLTRLVPQTDAAASAMRKLGLDFVDTKGNFLGITEIAGQLNRAFGNLSQEQATLALSDIFGSDAARAGALLAKEGAEGIQKYITAAKDLGAAQRMADTNTSGFKGALDQFKGSIETLQITLGLKLLPILTPIVKGFTDLANAALSGIEPIARVAGSIGSAFKGAFTFSDLAAAEGDAAAANLSGIQGVAQDVGRALGVAFAGVSGQSEIGEFDGPFRAINAAAVRLNQSLPTVRDALADIAAAVGGAAGQAWDLFGAALRDVGVFIGRDVVPAVVNLIDLVSPLLVDTLRFAANAATTVLKPALAAVGVILTDVIGPAVRGVTGFLAEHKTVVQAVAVAVAAAAAPFLAVRAATAAWAFTTGAASAVMTAFRAVVFNVRAAVTLLNLAIRANPMMAAVSAALALGAGLVYLYKNSETFRNVVQSLFGWVTDLGGVFGKVVDVIKAIPGALGDAGKWLLDIGKDMAAGLWDGITFVLGGIKDAFVAYVKAQFDLWTGVGSFLIDKGKALAGGLLDGARDVVTGIGGFLWDTLKRVFDGWTNVSRLLVSKGKDLLIGLWNGVVEWTGELGRRIAGLPGWIMGWVGDGLSTLGHVGKNLVIGLWNGIVGMASWLKDKVIGFVKWAIPGPIEKALGMASPSKVGVEIGRNFGGSIGLGVEAATGATAAAAQGLARSLASVAVPALTVPVTAGNVAGLAAAAQGQALTALTAAGPLTSLPAGGSGTTAAGAALTVADLEDAFRRALRAEGVSDVTDAVAASGGSAPVDLAALSRAQGLRADLMGRL